MWITLTAQRFKDKLLSTEYTKLSASGLFSGRTWEDVLASELESTAKFVRGNCPNRTPLGPDSTIPDELEDQALAYARMKFFTRFVELKGLWTEARKDEYLQALAVFERWANAKFRVVPPTEEAPIQASSGAGAASVIADPRAGDKKHTNGL